MAVGVGYLSSTTLTRLFLTPCALRSAKAAMGCGTSEPCTRRSGRVCTEAGSQAHGWGVAGWVACCWTGVLGARWVGVCARAGGG